MPQKWAARLALRDGPQAALEAAGQAGSAEAGARQLALAVAAALGAAPSGAAAAEMLQVGQQRADGRIAEATVAARLAATKVSVLHNRCNRHLVRCPRSNALHAA